MLRAQRKKLSGLQNAMHHILYLYGLDKMVDGGSFNNSMHSLNFRRPASLSESLYLAFWVYSMCWEDFNGPFLGICVWVPYYLESFFDSTMLKSWLSNKAAQYLPFFCHIYFVAYLVLLLLVLLSRCFFIWRLIPWAHCKEVFFYPKDDKYFCSLAKTFSGWFFTMKDLSWMIFCDWWG